ncbi:MAG: glycoside hydrolase family 140 protein [Fimbriimonadaceae bacterium]|nr:glycoside hydrolase family 140 protein [Fimbriimonadaceae bacterium]
MKSPEFPLRIADSGRHLEDQAGRPFLLQADTAWFLFFALTRAEALELMTIRKQQGFTTIQCQLTAFTGVPTVGGLHPFHNVDDLTRPNEAFFDHVEAVLQDARRLGLAVWIAPLWTGCCGEGWAGSRPDGKPLPMNNYGGDNCRALGRWLGRRFQHLDHIAWILGGDNDPWNALHEIRALAEGLKEGDPARLCTYHASSSHSSTDVWPTDESWLDVSMVYTYFRGFNKAWNKVQPDVEEVAHAEWKKLPVRPFFLGESTYEGEHEAWGSALQARRQAAQAILGGGMGHAYGSPNWRLAGDWRAAARLPGAESLKHLRAAVESRPWTRLQPDLGDRFAVAGNGLFAANDRSVAAVDREGQFAIAYLPEPRELTLDLGCLNSGSVSGWWKSAATGELTKIGPTPARRQGFLPPGEGDWLLILDAEGADFPAPETPDYS